MSDRKTVGNFTGCVTNAYVAENVHGGQGNTGTHYHANKISTTTMNNCENVHQFGDVNAETVNIATGTSGVPAKPKIPEDTLDGGQAVAIHSLHFGHDDTTALLVAGAGTGDNVFKNDVEIMKDLLISDRIGVKEDKIYPVFQSKTKTKTAIKGAIAMAAEELKGANNGRFIFFYSGHFGNDHTLVVDSKGDDDVDYYLDEDLAKDLSGIPAKYVLFITDMCFSGSANVGAKKKSGQSVATEQPPIPRLWEFFANIHQTKGKDKNNSSALKVVQWASSTKQEASYFHGEYSDFTKAITDVVTGPDPAIQAELSDGETHATVLQLNKHVTKKLKGQTSEIKPPHADEEYFKSYPLFAKIK